MTGGTAVSGDVGKWLRSKCGVKGTGFWPKLAGKGLQRGAQGLGDGVRREGGVGREGGEGEGEGEGLLVF